MAVNLKAPEKLLPVPGVRLGAAEAAIKKPGRKDLLVFEFAEGSQVAGVFTRNVFAAPPVLLCRERLKSGGKPIRALLVNSGNANAATGRIGRRNAETTSAAVAKALGIPATSVLPFSTGVIGQHLPVARMKSAIPQAVATLAVDGWLDAAHSIMTTDTVPKGTSRRVRTSQGMVTVTGIAKGVGMICPDMATLLAFVATDARLSAADTRRCLRDAVGVSFNSATVDGDTSTNDSLILVATGQASARVIRKDSADYRIVEAAIRSVCVELAQAVVRDGEGASRFVTLEISGARSVSDARKVAHAIAHSPLVKTALFAGDANWGRLAMAIGKSGVAGLSADRVSVALDTVKVLERGQPHPRYREARGAVVRDGEGASRFVTLEISGARSVSDARKVAHAIAHSPLVKTALFAGDANWGRLAMAIGKSGVPGLSADRVSVALDKVKVLERGQPHPRYQEARGAAVLAKPEFAIKVGLGMGRAKATVWTCDLGYEYVKINAEYRT